jgi:hypothetical protein
MAHFAKIGPDNVVIQTVVVGNKDCLDENGQESEATGIEFCKQTFQDPGPWVQCSYNGSIRGVFPMPGYIYDPDQDIFIRPPEPEAQLVDLIS